MVKGFFGDAQKRQNESWENAPEMTDAPQGLHTTFYATERPPPTRNASLQRPPRHAPTRGHALVDGSHRFGMAGHPIRHALARHADVGLPSAEGHRPAGAAHPLAPNAARYGSDHTYRIHPAPVPSASLP